MQMFLRPLQIRRGRYGSYVQGSYVSQSISAACSISLKYHSIISKACIDRSALANSSSSNVRWPVLLEPIQRSSPSVYAPQVRYLSLTPIRFDEPLKASSKVEATVKAHKEKQEKLPAEAPTKVVATRSVKDRVMDELRHYYHGFRLLFIDIRISYGLLWRVLNGHTLTRREYRLLMRTVGDMFRLVPFSVFIIVPFMEFLLPVFIKFFPGMLPSTFQTATEKEDKLKQSLKIKLEMAKFLQQTLDDMSVQHRDHNSNQAKEFSEWFNKVRTSGEKVSNEEIIRFSKLFQDEITLDSLSRNQLVALCRVLEVQTLGTNNLLRFQLRMKLRSLAADDKMIQKEGIDSLSLWEVQQACRARGMRAYGVTEARLRVQLQDWLDLSLNEKVPPSLLLLSRALMLPDTIPTSDKLKATISALPENIVTQTKHAIGEAEGKIDNKVHLEVIMEEARKINEERHENQLARAEEEMRDKAPVLTADTGIAAPKVEAPIATPKVAPAAKLPPADAVKATQQAEALHSKDVETLGDALEEISRKKKPVVAKVAIEELKEQMADYKEDVQDLKDAAIPDIKVSKAANRLFKRVSKMIKGMDRVLSQLEAKEATLKSSAQAAQGDTDQELLRIDEIMDAIRRIKKVPDDSRLKQIEAVLSKIDDDRDGSIKVEDVLKVIEIIGKENVQLNAKQVDELLDLLNKEETLEVEDKIEKALKRETEKSEAAPAKTPPVAAAAAEKQPAAEAEGKAAAPKSVTASPQDTAVTGEAQPGDDLGGDKK